MKHNHLFLILQICIFTFLTSCSHIASLCSTPTYSSHNLDHIHLNNKSKINNVYIKKSTNDGYGVYQKIIDNVIIQMKKNNINIVDSVDKANYILSLNIRNISIDIDYEFANTLRNSLLANDTVPHYIFDSNNSPHISSSQSNNILTKTNNKITYKKLTPSVLYTILGSGTGFAIGYLIGGSISISPFGFGLGGAVLLGGSTYLLYNTFRKIGVFVSYEILLEERLSQSIKHSRKSLTKSSSNVIDEVFFDFHDNWNAYTSKSIFIAIGSRALTDKMIQQACPIIAENVVAQFNVNK